MGSLANSEAFELGRTPSAGGLTDRFFDGNLMAIKVFRYGLSEQQVQNDFSNGGATFR